MKIIEDPQIRRRTKSRRALLGRARRFTRRRKSSILGPVTDPLRIEAALPRLFFAGPMNLTDDVVRAHVAEGGRSLSGLQITGQANPASAQIRSMRRMMFTLLTWVFGTLAWHTQLKDYLTSGDAIRKEIERHRAIARVAVNLPSGETVTLSPGGQNPLIKAVIEEFCPRFVPSGTVAYIGDAEDKFLHMDAAYLEGLEVVIAAAAKMPDIVVHDMRRNWLVLIEAVSTAGLVDGKRRKELKELFRGCRAGLVFVTAFETRETMQSFLSQISWETEVWIANNRDHLIHFNGERFLGPYPDVLGDA